jgi:predicted nucleotidyltransferase component of viral defense system
MQTVLQQMLSRYLTNTTEEKKNALKEILQEIILCGLSRAGFFKKAAFYGGTALRIFYGLDRFSEDLDFSLIEPDNQFELKSYFSGVKAELSSLGLEFSIEEKEKTQASAIKSAFLKGNTKEHILRIYGSDLNINSNEVIKIKFEIDTNPPPFATFENRYRLLPSPYQVKLYDAESLFAGKLHAVICRSWKNRVKGRDLYDYVFYLAKNTSINFTHLKARLEESGAINPQAEFGINELRELLLERFDSIDFEQAKKDVLPFILDKSKIEIWSKEFFTDITTNLI